MKNNLLALLVVLTSTFAFAQKQVTFGGVSGFGGEFTESSYGGYVTIDRVGVQYTYGTSGLFSSYTYTANSLLFTYRATSFDRNVGLIVGAGPSRVTESSWYSFDTWVGTKANFFAGVDANYYLLNVRAGYSYIDGIQIGVGYNF